MERIIEHVIVQEPVRQKLPRTRNSKTFSFRVADCRGFATVAEYEDGRPGELFLNVSKQGSTLAGIMDSFAISVSHGLQYGVPLRAFVETFTNRRFEPAGMTDDPDIRIATSLVDYIFRKLAIEYLPYDERVEIGVLTTGERMQPTLPGVEESMVVDEPTNAFLPPRGPRARPMPRRPRRGRPGGSAGPRPSTRWCSATCAATSCSGPGAATPVRAAARRAAVPSERRRSPAPSPDAVTSLIALRWGSSDPRPRGDGMRRAFAAVALIVGVLGGSVAQGSAVSRRETAAHAVVVAPLSVHSPAPVIGTDGRLHILYELQLTNTLASAGHPRARRGARDQPRGTVANLTGAELAARLRRLDTQPVPDTEIEQFSQRLLLVDLAFTSLDEVPVTVQHRVTLADNGATSGPLVSTAARVNLFITDPLTLGPPVLGSNWVVTSGCCNPASPHRSAILPTDAGMSVAQRFALDLRQMDETGRFVQGDPSLVESYAGYGTDILAVAPGRVVAVVDGFAEQVPGSVAPPGTFPVDGRKATRSCSTSATARSRSTASSRRARSSSGRAIACGADRPSRGSATPAPGSRPICTST